MPGCCRLSRRELLRWGALVATTPLVLAPDRFLPRAGAAPLAVPMQLELVTLTETSLVLTWFTGDPQQLDAFGRPAPTAADTEVLLGTSSGALRTVLYDDKPTPYHYAEVTGLEPGQTYYLVALSNGVPAVASALTTGSPLSTSTPAARSTPFVVTTPPAPAGKHLFSIALTNDLHVGEGTAGLVTSTPLGGFPPGFSQEAGKPPYAELMAEAMVADARARGVDVILAAGDLTSEASARDLARAKEILDGFGDHGTGYLVARGNHDRPHTGSSSCAPVPGSPDYHDCFRDAFVDSTATTWFSTDVHGLRVIGLDTYDKLGTGGDNGVVSAEQLDFLRAELAAEPDRPTLVFGHHPLTLEATATSVPPVTFDLDREQSAQIEALYAAAPGVLLHHAGHTHRNKRSVSTTAPDVVFQEVAATKEYPGGFHLLRVHEGGYALNFYKTRADLAREWSERTRQEYLGAGPGYTLGNASDRNHVVARDLSGLLPAS